MDNPVVNVARRWVGTPYQHQASCIGAGADCLGLVRGIWCELYGREPELVPAYTSDWNETTGNEDLHEALNKHLIAKTGIHAGDVLLFRMRPKSVAKHLAVVSQMTPNMQIIHAYSGRGVLEAPLSLSWQRRIAGVFRFPDRS